MTNEKGQDVTVEVISPSDINYTPIDYDKKVFTDYITFYDKNKPAPKRNAVNYGDNTLQHRWENDKIKAQASIFEQKSIRQVSKDSIETSVNGLWSHLSLNELCATVNQYSVDNAYWFAKKRTDYFKKDSELSLYIAMHPEEAESIKGKSWKSISKNLGLEFKLPYQMSLFIKENPKRVTKVEAIIIDLATLKDDVKTYSLQISKGLLAGGIAQKDTMYYSSSFMFFDVDVSETENSSMYEDNGRINSTNLAVYNALEKIAVACFRSSRKLGISGILYVPALENCLDNDVHKLIGGGVLAEINHKYLPIPVVFDKGQSQFTLGRRFPARVKKIGNKYVGKTDFAVNKDALEFIVSDYENVKGKTSNRKSKSKNATTHTIKATSVDLSELNKNELKIVDHYNSTNNVLDLFIDSGKYEVAGEEDSKGWTPMTKTNDNSSSTTSYNRKSNSFNCFSQTLNGTRAFHLLVQLYFEGDVRKAYESIAPVQEEITVEPQSNNSFIEEDYGIEPLFDIDFLNRYHYNKDVLGKKMYQIYLTEKGIEVVEVDTFTMLGYTERDKEFAVHKAYTAPTSGFPYEIEKLQGTDIETIIDLNEMYPNDENKRFLSPDIIKEYCTSKSTYVVSHPGTGKTTTFLSSRENNVKGMISDHKILFVMPRRTMILQQLADCHPSARMFASFGAAVDKADIPENIEFIPSIGNNPDKLLGEDGKVKSGFLTYNQFVNENVKSVYLNHYDYIVFDEAHLMSTDGFDVNDKTLTKISKLSKSNSDMKMIFMSATPETEIHTFSKHLNDFKILTVKKKHTVIPSVNIISVSRMGKAQRNTTIYRYIMNSINEGKKAVVYMNHGQKITKHWAGLQEYCLSRGMEVPTKSKIASENQDTETQKHIIRNERLVTQVLYTTSVLNVGINVSKGVEKGVSFFFDALDYNHAFDLPSSMEQLIMRNRLRKSDAYVFCSFYDEHEYNKDAKVSEKDKSFDNEYYVDNNLFNYWDIEPSQYRLNERGLEDILEIKEYEVREKSGKSFLSNYNKQTHQMRSKYKKSIYSFIRYAYRVGFQMNYEISVVENNGIDSNKDSTKFSLSLLKLLVDSNGIKDVKELTLIKTSGSVSSDITHYGDVFTIHEVYSSTFNTVVRAYIKLRGIYPCKETLIKVIGYAIDNESSRKTVASRLISYLRRFRFSLDSKVVLKALDYEMSSVDFYNFVPNDITQVVDGKVTDFVFKLLKDEMYRKRKNGGYSTKLCLITDEEMNKALVKKVREMINIIYDTFYGIKVSKKELKDGNSKPVKFLQRKQIIKSTAHHTNQNDTTSFKDIMSALNSNDSFRQADGIEALLNDTDDALDEKHYNSFLLENYTDRTSFDLLFASSKSNSNYEEAIQKLKWNNPKSRSTKAYICLDRANNNVVGLDYKLNHLFDTLVEDGITAKMKSANGVYYNTYDIFRNKYKKCLNYEVKKIDV